MLNSIALLIPVAFLAATSLAEAQKTPLEAAERLVGELRPDRNEYAYDNIFIKWKGQDGAQAYAARCDCSGLLTLLLEHVYGFTPEIAGYTWSTLKKSEFQRPQTHHLVVGRLDPNFKPARITTAPSSQPSG